MVVVFVVDLDTPRGFRGRCGVVRVVAPFGNFNTFWYRLSEGEGWDTFREIDAFRESKTSGRPPAAGGGPRPPSKEMNLAFFGGVFLFV